MNMEDRSLVFSCASVCLGGFGIFIALLIVYAGPFSPQPDIGTTIGEIAGNMRAAAQRALEGVPQPAPVPVETAWTIDDILKIAAPACGVLGLIAAFFALVRREPRRLVFFGMGVSIGAIVVQVFLIAALIIAGAIILVGIMQNMDSILG